MIEKISVIIPVYNVEKDLKECLDSVLSQDYSPYEIIVVDDGSNDKSSKICDEYAAADRRVCVVHKTNGGLSSSRNTGIKLIVGDYVLFLDSDDFWSDTDFLYNIAEIAKDKPDLICYGYHEYFDDKNKEGAGIDFSGYSPVDTSKNEVLKEMLIHGIYVSSACCKAINSSVFKDNSLFFREGITSEDIDWSARLLKCVDKIDVYPKSIYYYRQRSESIVHNVKYNNLEMLSDNIIFCVELSEDILPGEFKDLFLNYVAYQYITFLKTSLRCEYETRTKLLLKRMKSYSWLLKYHLNRKVKLVYQFKKIFGFNLMYKILKAYTKG